ncbi:MULTISPECIES: MFS transporter [unclassified Agrococcus]|uniref:MFS transporter n=1 Tax=unclassified Agrococcus TaxID=2615065 RepID=UPI00361B434E
MTQPAPGPDPAREAHAAPASPAASPAASAPGTAAASAPASAPASTARSASPFRRPAFRRLTVGWFASNLGDSALYLMLAVWVRELTGSDAAGALVFLALGAPTLLAPIVGHVADRVSRRRLLIAANAGGAALVLSLLAVHGPRDVWLIYVVTVGYGLVAIVTAAAQSGLLRDMLPDAELGSANGALSSIDNAMRIVSPPLGTVLYVAFGPWAVVLLTSLCFVATTIVLLTVRVAESPAILEDAHEPWMRQVTAGFRHLLSEPTLRLLTIVLTSAFAANGLLNATIFPFVEVGTGAGPEALGPLQAVQGAGAVLGGVTAAAVLRRIGERLLVAWGLGLLGAGLVVGLAFLYGQPDAAWMRWAGMGASQLLIGFSVPWAIVGVVTYRQRVTPPRLQGRTSAALNAAINVPQLGFLALGAWLLAVLDFRILVGVCAAAMVAAGIVCAAVRPRSAA